MHDFLSFGSDAEPDTGEGRGRLFRRKAKVRQFLFVHLDEIDFDAIADSYVPAIRSDETTEHAHTLAEVAQHRRAGKLRLPLRTFGADSALPGISLRIYCACARPIAMPVTSHAGNVKKWADCSAE